MLQETNGTGLVVTSMINENRLFGSLRRLFSGTAAEVVGELLQNSQRAGARQVDITISYYDGQGNAVATNDTEGLLITNTTSPRQAQTRPKPVNGRIVYRDDGTGLTAGVAGLTTMLRVADSYFSNPTVEAQQQPMGLGFYSLLAMAGVESVLIESRAAVGQGGLKLEVVTASWWNDAEYRLTWPSRVEQLQKGAISDNGLETGKAAEAVWPGGLRLTINCSHATALNIEQGLNFKNDWATPHDWDFRFMPCEGYSGILNVTLNGKALTNPLRQSVALPDAEIVTRYFATPADADNRQRAGIKSATEAAEDGYTLRIAFGGTPAGTSHNYLVVNWYGQLILTKLGYHHNFRAYLEVRELDRATDPSHNQSQAEESQAEGGIRLTQPKEGRTQPRPVNPKSPTRSGLIEDAAFQQLLRHIENLMFDYVRTTPKSAIAPHHIRTLYQINEERAKAECPYVVLGQRLPLGDNRKIVRSHADIDQINIDEQDGSDNVVAVDQLDLYLLLADEVLVVGGPLPGKAGWADVVKDESNSNFASYDFGLSSFLKVLRLEAYSVVVGWVEPSSLRSLWWKPGLPAQDELYTSDAGSWAIGAAPTGNEEEETFQNIMPASDQWRAFPQPQIGLLPTLKHTDFDLAEVENPPTYGYCLFVFEQTDSYDFRECGFFFFACCESSTPPEEGIEAQAEVVLPQVVAPPARAILHWLDFYGLAGWQEPQLDEYDDTDEDDEDKIDEAREQYAETIRQVKARYLPRNKLPVGINFLHLDTLSRLAFFRDETVQPPSGASGPVDLGRIVEIKLQYEQPTQGGRPSKAIVCTENGFKATFSAAS